MSPPPELVSSRRRGTRATLLARTERAVVREWIPADVGAVDAAQDPTIVKVPAGDDGRRLALAEAAALASLAHPHVAALRGLDDDGATLGILLSRLSTTTAAEWLAGRGAIPAGEAVTLLVPLLRSLAHIARRRLDGSGSVDLTPRVTLSAVLFDVRGAPILTGLRAGATRGPALLHQAPGGAVAAAIRLVDPVLAATRDADPRAVAALRAALTARSGVDEPPRAAIDRLIEQVFELAAPEPLTGIDFGSAQVARVAVPEPAEPPASTQGRTADLSALAARAAASRLAGQLREVRRRTWLTAGILVVSAVAAVVVTTPRTSPPPTERATVEPTATARSPSTSPRASAPTSVSESAAPRAGSDESRGILVGDDAAAAAALLLTLRAGCLDAHDDECLTDVEEAGSPILLRDAAAVRESRAPTAPPSELTLGAVVNGLGGAVLFAATTPDDEPASVLVTRSEAGWRLRSITLSGD